MGELNLKIEDYLESEKYLNLALKEHQRFEEMKSQVIDEINVPQIKIDINNMSAALLGLASEEMASLYSNLSVVSSKKNEFEQALMYIQKVRKVYAPDDFNIWSNLAEIYLKSGNLEAAEQEYKDVLRVSPYHLDSKIGLAETYIEMAETKDTDSYRSAIDYLTSVIQTAKLNGFLHLHQNICCPRLKQKDLANVFYSRGYARVKLYEKSKLTSNISDLRGALKDFRQCLKHNSVHHKAKKAIEKIEEKLDRFAPQRLVDSFGPSVLFLLSTIVFGLSQYGFWMNRLRNEDFIASIFLSVR